MACGPFYRLAQFRRALGARPSPAQIAEARALLTPAQWRLYTGMSSRDQWHSSETLRLLAARGRDDRDLSLAALLHDAAKGYIRLPERVLYVLLARTPWLLRRLASPRGPRWRTALHRSATHADAGANCALAAGCGARVAHLIRRHHTAQPTDAALAALIAADERA